MTTACHTQPFPPPQARQAHDRCLNDFHRMGRQIKGVNNRGEGSVKVDRDGRDKEGRTDRL